jgi:hypothetical protein
MSGLAGGLWGALGAVALLMFQVVPLLRDKQKYPWRSKKQRAPYLLSVFFTLTASAIVSAALTADGRITSPLPALLSGVAAPEILRRLAKGLATALASQQIEENAGSPILAPGKEDHSGGRDANA